MGEHDILIEDGPARSQIDLPVREAQAAPVQAPPSDAKPWYASKGTVGAIVAVLALGLGMAGYQVGPAMQAEIVQAWLDVVALGGAVIALVGRLTASKRVV